MVTLRLPFNSVLTAQFSNSRTESSLIFLLLILFENTVHLEAFLFLQIVLLYALHGENDNTSAATAFPIGTFSGSFGRHHKYISLSW